MGVFKSNQILFGVLVLVTIVVLCLTGAIDASKHFKPKKILPKIYPQSSNILNVHIVAHTHDDVGWLKTVDEYYYGANSSIQVAGVQYTLDGAIAGLLQNADRKFIYVEIAYFERWWNEQDDDMKKLVNVLVQTGQLEFINGGWCMNDEATTYYDDIIDQMTLGHQFLYKTFGVVPKIGWHVDPFGHSNTQASIFGNIGFDAFIIGRMDYQDIDERLANKQMEFMWRSSKSQPKYQVFTSVLRAMYCTPSGFNFENGDDPIQDDPNLFGLNIAERAAAFVAVANEYATHYQTNNVLIPFGCDFQYMNANMYFKNIDKLINYINANQDQFNINIFYSTPSIYIDAVNQANVVWNVKTDDLFPYADNPWSYWTGYFVSRPALKGYVRQNSQLLHIAEQLLVTSQSLVPNVQQLVDAVTVLRQAMGVAQHHDAVSGTEQQHVADDYAERLAIGYTATLGALNTVVGQILTSAATQPVTPPTMSFCPLLNVSICPSTDVLTNGGGVSVPIILYNSLSWARYEPVNIPVPIATISVSDESGPVSSQVTLSGNPDQGYILTFMAYVPALGFSSYVISNSNGEQVEKNEIVEGDILPNKQVGSGDIVLTNNLVSATFDPVSGSLLSITNVTSGQFVNITQNYLFYLPSLGDAASTQTSGAYIFRPIEQFPYNYNNQSATVTVSRGATVQTITRYWSPTMIQIYRLYDGVEYLEIEETVGPIDISDDIGKEVITRYNTSFNTANTWYTDSNGQEMQERIINYRPSWNFTVVQPTSGNYVPVNSIAYIQDTDQNLQLTFVVDRSRGCASLGNGELEMMLHRRTLLDDFRGVGEPMNESTAIVTTTRVIFHPIGNNAQSYYRPLAQSVSHPLYPIFTSTSFDSIDWINLYSGTYSPLTGDLPAGLKIQSLQWVDDSDDSIILRLENIYQIDGQDTVDPVTITYNIQQLFTSINVTSVTEMNLSGVTKVSNENRLQWKTSSVLDQPTKQQQQQQQAEKEDSFVVQIGPMDVRTYLITVDSSSFNKSRK